MKRTALLLGGIAAASVTVPESLLSQGVEQDVRRGHIKSMQCVACHGVAGISSNPMIPHLAGQNAFYLEKQLEHFKTGERYNPLMTPVAASLSRQDIVDLVTYFSSIGPLAAVAEGEVDR